MAGLPDSVCHAILAGLRTEGLDLASDLLWAQAVFGDELVAAAGLSAMRDHSFVL